MPRRAREQSTTGIYHVMLRGINQQQIFQDDEDIDKFLQILNDCKELSKYKLFAYCFMGNHVHILMQICDEPLELVFKRIGSRYVYWYNIKYQRVGHLFQDRYKSEPVNDEAYFLSVLRYIHQNPIKSGITKNCIDYKYSSYNCYYIQQSLVDTDYVLGIIDIMEFEKFHSESDKLIHLELDDSPKKRITDESAKKIIAKYSKCKSVEDYLRLPLDKQKSYLPIFKKHGLSVRQISRLTGLSKSLIQRID